MGILDDPTPTPKATSLLDFGKQLLSSLGFGGPSWTEKAQQLETAQRSGAPPHEILGMASDLLGGFGGVIKTFHGSPHAFAPEPGAPFGRFKDTAIGSGEGAQARGYGHYSAENPKVAETYSNMNNYNVELAIDGVPWSSFKGKLPANQKRAMEFLNDWGGNFGAARAKIGHTLSTGGYHVPNYEHLGPATKLLDGLKQIEPRVSSISGRNLYDVTLAPEPEDYLHLDKPINEQSQQVQEKLAKLDLTGKTGDELYLQLEKRLGSDVAASKALYDVGIPGLRFFDQFSREVGEGTHNYVTFDPSQMEITARNGQPAPSLPPVSKGILDQ